jgi:hypothetical protein
MEEGQAGKDMKGKIVFSLWLSTGIPLLVAGSLWEKQVKQERP